MTVISYNRGLFALWIRTAYPPVSSPSFLSASTLALWICLLSTSPQAVSVSCYSISPCCCFCLVVLLHPFGCLFFSLSLIVDVWLSPPTHMLSSITLFWLTLVAERPFEDKEMPQCFKCLKNSILRENTNFKVFFSFLFFEFWLFETPKNCQ